jgi:predicted PurR-regulated permease PerM
MSRGVAAFIIIAGFALAFVLLLLLITPPLVRQFSSFIDNAPGYAERLQALASDPNHPWIKRAVGDNLAGESAGTLMSQAMVYISGLLASLWSKGQALISVFSLLIITPVVAFYLGSDWDRIVRSVDELIPLKQRETVRGLAREIDATVSAYVHGQSGVCLILGSYYAVGLTAAGLRFGFLIGVVCGLISFIPYAGSLTALVVSLCVAVAQFFPEWGHIVIVVAIVLVGQFIEGNVLAPKLVGRSVGLHPVWLIFALFAFGYLFGFVGLLLAVPLAAAAGVLIRFSLRRYRESPLYTGSRPT